MNKQLLKVFCWFFGAVGASYFAREAWIWYNLKDLKNKIVLITGGTEGIGLLMAEKLAQQGAIVVIWARDVKKLERAKSQIQSKGGKVHIYSVDVSDRKKVYETAERVRQEVGDVQILINNAGITHGKQFLDTKDEECEKVINVNFLSHIYTTRAFLPRMIERNDGHIVTVSSAGALLGTNGLADYCASKFAAFGFNEALRAELREIGHASKARRGKGVQVTCICPYFIQTGMFEGVQANNFPMFLPILEPEYVAEKSIQAIRRSEALVIMPAFPWLVYLLRTLAPPRLFDFIMYDVCGVGKTTKTFDGTKTTRHAFNFGNLQSKL